MNVKLMLLLCLLVTTVAGGWWGRRRRHRQSSSGSGPTVSGSLDCPGGRCSGTVSVTKTWNNDRTSLDGHLSCQSGGGCGAGISFKHRFKRQAMDDTNKFVITLNLPPCNFESYDLNEDGSVDREELEAWFEGGDNQNLRDSLLYSLDTDGDELVSIQEFYSMAPTKIEGCNDQVETNGEENTNNGNSTQTRS